jgi:hypothetical protein
MVNVKAQGERSIIYNSTLPLPIPTPTYPHYCYSAALATNTAQNCLAGWRALPNAVAAAYSSGSEAARSCSRWPSTAGMRSSRLAHTSEVRR